ncbi:MAG TPA: protein kinase [Thermoanaerobaculia bacterium]
MAQPDTLLEGKYEILNKIREGGMGTIYRVRHRLLEEVRVIKVMRAHVAADPDLKRRFLEEAKTATRLKHPNICAIYDFALDEDGTAYLVMEFIEGINLSELLALRGRPSLPLTLEIAHQALLALAYLHRKNVIHRDVAPDNLMLTRDEEEHPLIKLIDLGIAKTADRLTGMTATGVFLGKLRYASPEQYGSLHAGEKLDGRSDLYSLGVVLYELLTGVRPFSGESPAEMLRGHVFNPPLPFSESDPEGNVPPELRGVILKALEKRREDRYPSAEEFDLEILSIRKRHSRPEDLRHTGEILSTLPRVELVTGKSVTPSAQDRLDQQFGPHTTATRSEEATVSPMLRALDPLSRRRVRALWIVAPLLAAAALLLLWHPWTLPSEARRVAAVPQPAPSESPASRSETTATPRPEPTAPPTTEPAPTAPLTFPAVENARLREAVDAARAQASSARKASERAGAPRLAAEAYGRARIEETEARRLAAHGEDAAAAAAFGLAARLYAQSETSARKAPAPSATPAPLIAGGPGPTPRPEPARAAAVPAQAPSPESQTLPAAATAAAPPVRPASDQEKIRETVHRYEQAQSSLDADLYSRIFPSADRGRIQQAFESFRSQSVQFEVRRIQIDPGGTRAEVYGYEKRAAVPRAGSEQRMDSERVMRLEKRGEGWVITSLK